MQKNPDMKPEAPEIPPARKARRNRRETECRVKLRSWGHCGICGSADLIVEVLRYCQECGAERYEIRVKESIWPWERSDEKLCGCEKRRRLFHDRQFTIEHCNACGAHKGPRCPNCRQPMWYRFSPEREKKHCTHCGFQNL